MHTRQRDRGVAFVRALAADPTAVLRAPADASAAEANASEAAAPDDATSRLGALAHAASVQKPKRKTKLVNDSPEALEDIVRGVVQQASAQSAALEAALAASRSEADTLRQQLADAQSRQSQQPALDMHAFADAVAARIAAGHQS